MTVFSPWDRLDEGKYREEGEAVVALLAAPSLSASQRIKAVAEGVELVEAARKTTRKQGVVESFLAEFSLGTREGLAVEVGTAGRNLAIVFRSNCPRFAHGGGSAGAARLD